MIAIIAAMTRSKVIGKDNKLPWNIKEDLKLFKELTTNQTVIMGRKTYESIGRPLPNRQNIVVSSTLKDTQVQVATSLKEAINLARYNIFIIGGASMYKEALPLADTLYISEVKEEYEGDTFFPEFDRAKWKQEERIDYNEFTFFKFTKSRSNS